MTTQRNPARLGLLAALAIPWTVDLPLYDQTHALPRRRRGGAARRRRWAGRYRASLHWAAFGRTPSPTEGRRRWERQRREREARRRQRGQR